MNTSGTCRCGNDVEAGMTMCVECRDAQLRTNTRSLLTFDEINETEYFEQSRRAARGLRGGFIRKSMSDPKPWD